MDTGKIASHHNAFTYATANLAPIDENMEGNFESPPGEVAFFSNPSYRVRITVGLSKYIMQAPSCLVNLSAGLNLVNYEYPWPQRRKLTQQLATLRLQTDTKQMISVVKAALLILQMWDLQFYTLFRFVKSLTVDVLLGKTFIDQFSFMDLWIRGTWTMERKFHTCIQAQSQYSAAYRSQGS